MLRPRALWLAPFFALACTIPTGPAHASTKCLCNDGTVTHSMADGEGVCAEACETFGGGRTWVPEDAAYEEGDGAVRTDPNARRIRARVPAAQGPARNR